MSSKNREKQHSGQGGEHSLGPEAEISELEEFKNIAATLSKTIQSVNDMQSSIARKAAGITEEARRAILDEVKYKIEQGKDSIIQSMEQHTKVINNALNLVINRVEDLKTIQVSATGHIVDKSQSDQS